MLLPLPAITSVSAIADTIKALQAEIKALQDQLRALDPDNQAVDKKTAKEKVSKESQILIFEDMLRLLRGEHAGALLPIILSKIARVLDGQIISIRELALALPDHLRCLDERLSSAAIDSRASELAKTGRSSDGRQLLTNPPFSVDKKGAGSDTLKIN